METHQTVAADSNDKLIKNTIVYTIGNSLPMAVTFFLLPLYTKYLSPHEYGIVGSMEAVKIFFTIESPVPINVLPTLVDSFLNPS